MVVVLLVLVEALEVVHASFDLLRHGELEGFVGWPVACGQYFDIEVDRVFLRRTLGHSILSVIPVGLCLVLREFEIVHHALDAVGHLTPAVDLQLGDDASLVLDALRLLAEQSASQIILERLNEDVFVREMREEFHHSFQLLFKLFVGDLEPIFPKDVVCVRAEDLRECVLPNLEVDELLEALRPLDLKRTVGLEAVLHDTRVLLKHVQQLGNNLTCVNDFLYFKQFAVRVVQLNLLQHVLALLSNE